MANEKRNGMTLPTGILQATGQGADVERDDAPDDAVASKPAKGKKRTRADKPAAGADRDGWKLYLSEDVRFRLRMLAFKRGAKPLDGRERGPRQGSTALDAGADGLRAGDRPPPYHPSHRAR